MRALVEFCKSDSKAKHWNDVYTVTQKVKYALRHHYHGDPSPVGEGLRRQFQWVVLNVCKRDAIS